jgi:hypothetical protein
VSNEDHGWADIVMVREGNWKFTVGWDAEIFESRDGIKSEYHAETAMEAAWQRMQKHYKAKQAEDSPNV